MPMITIDEMAYQNLAAQLAAQIRETHFFNGRIAYTTENYTAELSCSLIIYRDPVSSKYLRNCPVWWEFYPQTPDGESENDFDWEVLNQYLDQLLK